MMTKLKVVLISLASILLVVAVTLSIINFSNDNSVPASTTICRRNSQVARYIIKHFIPTCKSIAFTGGVGRGGSGRTACHIVLSFQNSAVPVLESNHICSRSHRTACLNTYIACVNLCAVRHFKNQMHITVNIENGLSAYELAVQYGYEGTIQEWLETLNGKSAYEIAKESGYSGTEEEWLASLKATADSSAATIKTAAFSSDGDLLLTLSDDTVINVGKAVGSDGAKGDTGAAGAAGKDGVSITSANINAEGQLVLNFSDGKTVNLDKVVGVNGKDGIGITCGAV